MVESHASGPEPDPEAAPGALQLMDEQTVTRSAIRRFSCAIGAMDDWHHDVTAARALGYPDLLAPAYFFTSMGLAIGRIVPRSQLSEDGSPLDDDLAGKHIMAGETAVTWHDDIFAGDHISIWQRLLLHRTRTGRTGPLEILTYERRYRRGGQDVVVEEFVRLAR